MTAGSCAAAPLLERDRELAWFDARLSALRPARTGGGRCVLIIGEAGAGKTALLEAVRARCGDDVHGCAAPASRCLRPAR